LGYICFHAHSYYLRIRRAGSDPVFDQIVLVFIVVLDLASTCLLVSLLIISELSVSTHPNLHSFFTVLYFAASLTFQGCIDNMSARIKGGIPQSFFMNVTLSAAAVFSGLLFLVAKDSTGLFYHIATTLQILGFVGVHVKYVFVGSCLLGGRFLPHSLIIAQNSKSVLSAQTSETDRV
jgi:hypothetical protein